MYKSISALVLLAASSWAMAGPVNINTADVTTLDQELAGVGPVVAQRIVEHRQQHGAFATAEELTEVRGIGPVILGKNRDSIVLK